MPSQAVNFNLNSELQQQPAHSSSPSSAPGTAARPFDGAAPSSGGHLKGFQDTRELAAVNVERLHDAQTALEQFGGNVEHSVGTPAERIKLLRTLNAAQEQVKRMIGAEVTDPLVTDTAKALSRLTRMIEAYPEVIAKSEKNVEALVNQSTREGALDASGVDALKRSLNAAHTDLKTRVLGALGAATSTAIENLDAALPLCEDKVGDAKQQLGIVGKPRAATEVSRSGAE